MLSTYLDKLQHSIHWAHIEDDIDVLSLARESFDQLLHFVGTLPLPEQLRAHRCIDQVLPMEWPLWMEACRYEDGYSPRESVQH